MKITPKHYRILFYTYTIIVLLLAVLPLSNSVVVINNIYVISIRMDYILHFVIFMPWVFLLRMVSNWSFKTVPVKTLALILAGLLFASSTELVQYFLAYRAFNINDLIANNLGVLLGAVVFLR
ncbi:MAG: VanZ family protein [Bacteroidales bacterium]